jgi:hypothetical protein
VSEKDELLRALDHSIAADAKRKAIAGEIVEEAAEGEAIAKATRTIVSSWPVSSTRSDQLIRLTEGWRLRADQSEGALTRLQGSPVFQLSTATASLTTTMAPRVLSGWVGPEAEAASEQLRSILFRPSLFDEVRSLMTRLGLDATRPGFRSSVECLEAAHAALKRTGAGGPDPTAVLIPARESIDRALADLMQRLPKQTTAGSSAAKIAVIGGQCAADGYSSAHFALLGDTVTELRDDLSAIGKQKAASSEEIVRLFDASLYFLKALAEGTDTTRLR